MRNPRQLELPFTPMPRDYVIYINGKCVGSTYDRRSVWAIIGKYPFASMYEVVSETGKDVSEFIPF